MRGAIAAKELQDQRPFLVLSLCMLGLEIVGKVVAKELDRQVFHATWSALREGLVWAPFFIAVALGTGLLTRERDDGTMAFLDSLPITRTRVFFAKTAVAAGVLCILPVGTWGLAVASHSLSRTSLDVGAFDSLAVSALLSGLALVYVGLAVGLLVGFSGRLAWPIVAMAALILTIARKFAPGISDVFPFELLDMDLEKGPWPFRVGALSIQIPVATTFLLVSWFLFTRDDRRNVSRLERFLRRMGRVMAGVLKKLLVVGAALAVVGAFFQQTESGLKTRHYIVTFPEGWVQFEGFSSKVDKTFDAVAALLRTDEGQRLTLLIGDSQHNTKGTTAWDQIRIARTDDEDDLLLTLAHETAHALASRIARGDASGRLAEMTVFNESVATYVADRIFPGPDVEKRRFTAAALRTKKVDSSEIFAGDLLDRLRGPAAKYNLGPVFVESIVNRHGESALNRLFVSVGRADAPSSLKNLSLWQDVFYGAGIDLMSVVDSFYADLDKLVADRLSALGKLPTLKAAIFYEQTRVGVRPLLSAPLPSGWSVGVQFRPKEDSEIDDYTVGEQDTHGVFWRSRGAVAGTRVWYQMELNGPGGVTVPETWDDVPLVDAP